MITLHGAGCLTQGNAVAHCTWSLEETWLVVSPEGGAPLAMALGSLCALSGDGYAIRLQAGAATLELSRLGAGGATLLEELWRAWPVARAQALHIHDVSGVEHFSGSLDRGHGPTPCRWLLQVGALLAAPEGADLSPLFLPLLDAAGFEQEAYAWRLEAEGGEAWTVSRLSGRTERFGEALSARRAALAAEAEAALAVVLPGFGGVLAAAWPPGRFRTLVELEALAPGIGKALRGRTAAGPRKAEAALLLAAAELYLAMARPGWGGEATTSAPEGDEAASEPSGTLVPEGAYPLWALARLGSAWILEALSEGDHATYVFSGGEEVPGLVSRLLCAPQLPLATLHLAEMALAPEHVIPARDLPFLRELRARFRKRVIHSGHDAWRHALESG